MALPAKGLHANRDKTAVRNEILRNDLISAYTILRKMTDIPGHNMRAIGVAIIRLENALDILGGTGDAEGIPSIGNQ